LLPLAEQPKGAVTNHCFSEGIPTCALVLFLQAAAAAALVDQVSGAMTNLVFRCASPAATANTTVIVRVFGTGGKLFSQKDERNIFLLASDLGLGPKCLVGRALWVLEHMPAGEQQVCVVRTPEVTLSSCFIARCYHLACMRPSRLVPAVMCRWNLTTAGSRSSFPARA
jgi:hypothetical protein